MIEVHDNPARSRYEAQVDGEVAAFVDYRRHGDSIVLVHTETVPAYRGQGIAERLVRDTLDAIRGQGRTVVPQCPFVAAFIGDHPEYADLIAA
jgi:uncharacterized protein